jgi:argininosuccinate lyase
VVLVTIAVRGMALDTARLASRAAEGGTTLTELADHLVREHGVPFKAAHAIASRLARAHSARPDAPLGAALATASGDLLGVPLQYSDARIAQILSARHFVEVRQTHGGPAPAETGRAIEQSRRLLEDDRAWLRGRRAALQSAEARLRTRIEAL